MVEKGRNIIVTKFNVSLEVFRFFEDLSYQSILTQEKLLYPMMQTGRLVKSSV